MGAVRHQRGQHPGARSFPSWAIDAGLRPRRASVCTFTGVLIRSRAPFSVTRVGDVTTLRAAAPAASGLQDAVYAWWDPVYTEMACGAQRIAHSDLACAFMSRRLHAALSDPALAGVGTDGTGPTLAWLAGQVVVECPGRIEDPRELSALVEVLDAAVVAVEAARLDRLIDLEAPGRMSCRVDAVADSPADAALAAIFATAGALVAMHDRGSVGPAPAGFHGLRREEPAAFQPRFWALGISCSPTDVFSGVVPGTGLVGRLLWGRGPEGCAAAAAIIAVPSAALATVAARAEDAPGAWMAGGCLVVVAADAAAAGPELANDVTGRAAALLAGVHSE